MKYKVHRIEINLEKDHDKLEQFLNNLRGEVVSIIPNIANITRVGLWRGLEAVLFGGLILQFFKK